MRSPIVMGPAFQNVYMNSKEFKSQCSCREMLLERTPLTKRPRQRIPRNSKHGMKRIESSRTTFATNGSN